MAVRSGNMQNDQVIEPGSLAQLKIGIRLLGLVCVLLGVALWLPGARFTVDGLFNWLNAIVGWFGVPPIVQLLIGWPLIIGAGIAGLIFSCVEIGAPPVAMIGGRLRMHRDPIAWIGWLVLVAIDVGTTFSGLRTPNTTMPRWVQQISASDGWSAGCSLLLTFAPELLMLGGLALLGIRRNRQ